jgi:hypothetical protein
MDFMLFYRGPQIYIKKQTKNKDVKSYGSAARIIHGLSEIKLIPFLFVFNLFIITHLIVVQS